jgi:hypothetical protein
VAIADIETVSLRGNARFLEIIEQSRQQQKAGKVVSSEEARRKLGLGWIEGARTRTSISYSCNCKSAIALYACWDDRYPYNHQNDRKIVNRKRGWVSLR